MDIDEIIEQGLEYASDTQIFEEAVKIEFTEEQCLTFIGVLIEKLKVKFNKKLKLMEE